MNNFKRLLESKLIKKLTPKENIKHNLDIILSSAGKKHSDYKKAKQMKNNLNLLTKKDMKWINDCAASWSRRNTLG